MPSDAATPADKLDLHGRKELATGYSICAVSPNRVSAMNGSGQPRS